MSIRALNWALKQDDIDNSGAKFVLLILANFADEDGVCYPSQTTIARLTAMSERSVRNHLEWLVTDGFIARSVRRVGSRRSTDEYRLNFATTELNPLPEEFAGSRKGGQSQPENPAGSCEAEESAASEASQPANSALSTGKLRQCEPANPAAHIRKNHQREPSEDTQEPDVSVPVSLKAIEPEPEDSAESAHRFVGREYHKDLGGTGELRDVDDLTAFGPYRDGLEDWYCQTMGTVSLPPNAATATQITWLYENKFTLDEIRAFYAHAKGEGWRQGGVNLGAIVKGIGEWRAAMKNGNGSAPAKVDFSWCTLGCIPSTGMIEVFEGGESMGWKKCAHAGKKAA